MNWTVFAHCRVEGTDPELFFPASYTGPGAAQTERAKAVCARCPVTAECLDYALDEGIEFGGVTPAERRSLSRTGGSPSEPHEWALAT